MYRIQIGKVNVWCLYSTIISTVPLKTGKTPCISKFVKIRKQTATTVRNNITEYFTVRCSCQKDVGNCCVREKVEIHGEMHNDLIPPQMHRIHGFPKQ